MSRGGYPAEREVKTMAKKFNIIRALKDELSKGNEFINSKGDSVNRETLDKQLEKDYINGLKKKEIDFTVSFEDYKKEQYGGKVGLFKIEYVLEVLEQTFEFNYRPYRGGKTAQETEQETEQKTEQETAQETAQETEQKKERRKRNEKNV